MFFKKSKSKIKVWWHNNNGTFNFGDELNPYLVRKISGKSILRVHKIPRFAVSKINICIGSVIIKANRSCDVWGAGIIEKNAIINKSNYLAVRGVHTQNRMREMGIIPPKVIGDPALVLPLYYAPKIEPRYDFGIIPHVVDYDLISPKMKSETINIINFSKTEIEQTINEIVQCKLVISSSLHGIIVANAYNIPAIWVKFSDRLYGDDIKFYDYFSSVGIDEAIRPISIDPTVLNKEKLLEISETTIIKPSMDVIHQVQKNLLDVCPFK